MNKSNMIPIGAHISVELPDREVRKRHASIAKLNRMLRAVVAEEVECIITMRASNRDRR